MDNPTTPPTAPSPKSPPSLSQAPATNAAGWRRPVGLILSIAVMVGAAVLTLRVWSVLQHHPRTDDAIVRANVIGVTPRVRGQIVRLAVQDNQAVAAGDVLFEI